ncbi:MAG TPA: sulfatase-like hydrolase/transferase [Acidobacteriaceae bacterium]|nr:sulfatase-like hydrolase/transferase [Acidobacteriaceae bacterium]
MSNSDLTRRGFLGLTGAAALGNRFASAPADQTGIGAEQSTAPGSRPNIILFVPDEMRADALACYGNPVTKTPNFDRMAAEGAKFANCHVQFPVCGPSRCSMMTGWPASVRGHRSQTFFLRRDEPNLFRYLKHAGYDVFWFGKNDMLAAESFYDSVTRWKEGGIYVSSPGQAATTVTPGVHSFLFPPIREDRRQAHDYTLLQAAFEVLERREADRPFCIFLALTQPHPPYEAPADFYSMYSPSAIPPLIPPGLPRRPAFHEAIRDAYRLRSLSDEGFRKVRAVYYGQVSFVDWMLGELLEALERTNHAKDTALICISDHGDYAGDFGLVEKGSGTLEDPLTHVPLLLRIPGGVRGVSAEEMVEAYDVMQTCLDLAGIEAQHTHFARTLLPQAHGKPGDPDRAAFAEAGDSVYTPQCFQAPLQGGPLYEPLLRMISERPEVVTRCTMVRTREAKLIVRPHGQNELYSYRSDPQERENIYGERNAAGLQDALQQRLLHWFINTTGVPPFDRDQRNCPPFYAGRHPPEQGWQQMLLDT